MRIAIGVEYDGRAFSGWQAQRHDVRVVQTCVERALGAVAAGPVRVHCAGRTDTGVHALAQVAHFDTDARRSTRAWTLGANVNLPSDVSVLWAREMPAEFHARYSALAREYAYVILNRSARPGLWAGKLTWECRALDAGRMSAAAAALVGEHDFSAFRAAGCQARHAIRHLERLDVTRRGDLIVIRAVANAFLQHMVRNLAGTLLEIGRGARPPAWAGDVLASRDRAQAGMTAPPDGLYFLGARYPARYGLPGVPGESFFPHAVV